MNQFFLAAVPVVGFVHGVVRPPLGLPLPEDEDVPHREGIERERTDTRASVAARPDLSQPARDHQWTAGKQD